jgi:hypothetical protein
MKFSVLVTVRYSNLNGETHSAGPLIGVGAATLDANAPHFQPGFAAFISCSNNRNVELNYCKGTVRAAIHQKHWAVRNTCKLRSYSAAACLAPCPKLPETKPAQGKATKSKGGAPGYSAVAIARFHLPPTS